MHNLLATVLLCALVASHASAEDASASTAPRELPAFTAPADESASYEVETVHKGLESVSGLAIKPGAPEGGPYQLLVADGRQIIRISTATPAEAAPAVKGFPLSVEVDGPKHRLRPSGLEFLTRTKLAVGIVGRGKGAPSIRVYALPDDGSAIAYEQVDHAVELNNAEQLSGKDVGAMFGLTRTDNAIFAASGDEPQGWLLKASLQANRLSDLQPFVATQSETGVSNPRAVIVNPKPHSHYLIAGNAGELDAKRDSVIAFYGPVSGELAMAVRTGLFDVAGLAYSPTGDLYALDYSHHDKQLGGVFRIEATEVDGRQSCRAVKIAAVQRPTAIVFTPDGTLYVGANEQGDAADSDKARSVLLKITPRPDTPPL